MRNKLLKIFLVVVIALPVFTSVFAISSEDLLARLDSIIQDISSMKQEYEDILNTYPDVIASLSAENKDAALNLTENLMAEDVETVVSAIKAELAASTVTDADKVLTAINDLQQEAESLIENNKDIVEEVKTGYEDLTVDEVKEIVEKVKDITESLGAEVDTTTAYNGMMDILDDAHTMALAINSKIEVILSNNLTTFESAMSIDLIKDLFNAVKAKDREEVIDVLVDAINNAEGGAALKEELKILKQDAVDVKDKLMEIGNLNEEELLFFTDVQKEAVSDKIKEVELDYVDFAKVLLDTYSEDYMQVVIDLAYDQTVDDMVRYANKAVDYVIEYKDVIKNLSIDDVVSVLPQDLVQKAGMMVALGFVDISEYNLDYIKENFGTQIDNLVNYLADELVAYIENIDETMQDELFNEMESAKLVSVIQENVRGMSSSRFKTLASIKELKDRVDTELIKNREELKENVNTIAEHVYDIYNLNILDSIESVMLLENDKEDKKYEFNNDLYYILSDKFMVAETLMNEIGIPSEYSNVVTVVDEFNSSIKTGTMLNVTLSSKVATSYACIVLGDVYADGMIDARDYMAIKNQIMENDDLAQISLIAADTYRDEEIDARDYMVIKNEIMEGNAISL